MDFKVLPLGIFMCLLALISGCGSNHFSEANNALTKSFYYLKVEPGVAMTGYASDPKKDVMKIAFSVKDPSITTDQADKIIIDYLNQASSFYTLENKEQFLKSHNLQVEVYKDNLNGMMLFVGQKEAGSNLILWK